MKVAGALCVLLGCIGNGMVTYRGLKEKYNEMVYIKQILQMLKNLTETENVPFPETCFLCGERLRNEYGKIFYSLFKRLEAGEEPINQCWEKTVSELSLVAGLNKEEEGVLHRIIPNASFLSSFSPADSIELVLEEWDKKIMQAQEKMKKNGKLSFVLNVSAGCLICLILV